MLFGLLFSLFYSNVGLSQAPQIPQISVYGEGIVLVTPDVFSVSFSVVEEGTTIPKMAEKVENKVARIVGFLSNQGIDKQLIQSSSVNLQPIYRNSNLNQGKKEYQLSQRIEIVINDFDNYAKILHGVLERGATAIQSFESHVKDDKKVYREALNLALEDGIKQAQQLASKLNLTLGEVLLIQELQSGGYTNRSAVLSESIQGGAYQQGQKAVSAKIQLVYSVR